MLNLLLLLLPVAAAMGWYLGNRDRGPREQPTHNSSTHLPRDYFVGLNFLLNEEPDKAVDVFVKMLEVDSDTVETHLALGNLFRRRGEIDRAIRIHQNLIARPHLNKAHRSQALLELAQDYIAAGVLDRAERLCLDIIEMGGSNQLEPSLRLLLDIYQREREWDKALEIAQRLEVAGGARMCKEMAHYYCELSEKAIKKGGVEQAQRHLKKALSIDNTCARAMMALADFDKQAGDYRNAIRYYQKVGDTSPELLSEVIVAMVYCYEQLGHEEELLQYLQHCIETMPRTPLILVMAEHLQRYRNAEVAADFMTEQLQTRPSLRGLNRLMELQLLYVNNSVTPSLRVLQNVAGKLVADRSTYRCNHCGFSAKHLLWQCPGCRHWGEVKPIDGGMIVA